MVLTTSLWLILEITRQDIEHADARVGESARGLLGTIRDTYTQKKHGTILMETKYLTESRVYILNRFY